MAWNHSTSGAQAAKGEAPKKANVKRGVLAGAIVVLVGIVVIAVMMFSGEEKQDQAVERNKGRIKEVKPALAPTNAVVETEKVEYRKLENGKIMKYVDGKKAWMYPREDYHGPAVTSGAKRVETIVTKTFKHTADRQIASLLTIRPGAVVTGGPNYRRTFVKDFLASYENPAIPEPGDTEEQRELKRVVAEVKGELKARYEAGEDIAKIMQDTRNELRQLNVYKRELEQQVRDLSKDGNVSAQDVEDYVNAANKMLSDRGVEPIKVRGFLKYQILMKKQKVEATEDSK